MRPPRVRWWGALEVALVLLAITILGSTLLFARQTAAVDANHTRDRIRAEQARLPIETPAWRTYDAGFGRIELPGTPRQIQVQIPGGDKVKAILAGGHGEGVGAAEIRFSPRTKGPGAKQQFQRIVGVAGLVSQVSEELGITVVSSLLGAYNGQNYPAATCRAGANLLGRDQALPFLPCSYRPPAAVADRDSKVVGSDGTVAVSLTVVEKGDRAVLVVSAWHTHDRYSGRAVRSVEIG